MSAAIGADPAARSDNSPREDPPNDDHAGAVCPLCYEVELAASSAVTLSACHHRSCRACLARWIEREEASGRRTPPGCPFCRARMGDEEVVAILGRPFRPRLADHPVDDDDGGEGIGDLTLQWMNEHTVPCRACGSRIEKDGGCDLIECLCGYRFCYVCGAPGGDCDCNPGHVFDADLFFRNDTYCEDPAVRDGNGVVDLRSCIRRREVKAAREARGEEVRAEASLRWDLYAEDAAVCPSSGRWLFVPSSDAGSTAMLSRQLGALDARAVRMCGRYARGADECRRWDTEWNTVWVGRGNRWPLPRRRETLAAGRIVVRSDLVDDSWLFLPRGEDVAALRRRARGLRYEKKGRAARLAGTVRDALRRLGNRARRN